MQDVAEHLRGSSVGLTLPEALQRPVGELIGVGPDAAAALGAIAVETIFDLGSSSVFAAAAAVVAASGSPAAVLPTDVLGDVADTVPLRETQTLPLAALRVLSETEAAALESALQVSTIRELAFWPARRTAHLMVATSAGTMTAALDDPGAELRPRFGEYPTERVYYDSLIMLGSSPAQNLVPLSRLSLARIVDQGIGFGEPAIGAIASYSQSWFAQGITLGHMTHSLALAPGEATRIAVVDWTRRTSASTSESVAESESLRNSQNHARAVSEVQNAVAEEMQEGGSASSGWAKSKSKSKGFAGSLGGGIAGTIGAGVGALGIGLGGSYAKQSSETSFGAESSSWSVGSRSMLAEMNQRVNDRTEQHANSVRNRRATAVREVSQSEHEEVSTRIVANYNHMHALTVQYFEVVQVYRVSVRLNRFDRALFLPFDLLDFSGADALDVIGRFRGELLEAALTPRAAELLLDDRGRVELRGAIRVHLAPTLANAATTATAATGVFLANSAGGSVTGTASEGTTEASGDPVLNKGLRLRTVSRPGPVADVLPGDAELVSVAFSEVTASRVRIDRDGVPADDSTFLVPAGTMRVDLADRMLLREVRSFHVARDQSGTDEGEMVLRYRSEARESLTEVPISLREGSSMQPVAFLSGDAADRRAELIDHLQANRGYYTRSVLERLDSTALTMLLAGTSWLGRPLVDQVEPNAVAVTGNYLVLRAPAEDDDLAGTDNVTTWGQLLASRDIDFSAQDERLVPIPAGGVFAEAVLGRSNSAEKLDITRFWNWQDSPIPLTPPEIAPVSLASRGATENLTPSQLGAPVLNIAPPTVLPEPAGLTAALGALANGSMFRDMSGLAGTQASAQGASAGTLAAATEAGRIASTNFQAATTQATEMGKAAADMFKVTKSASASESGAKASAGVSGEGARINQGRSLDERGVSAGGAPTVRSQQAQFGSSSTRATPTTESFSRELAFSDDGAAVSPNLLAATTAALGGGANLLSSLPFVGEAISNVVAGFTALVDRVPQFMLDFLASDAAKVGLPTGNIKLIPMTKHDHGEDFMQVGFFAWTNNSRHVYVNLASVLEVVTSARNNGATDEEAAAIMRFKSAAALEHELQHVQQFVGNGDQVPQTFAEMILFEKDAYTGSAEWVDHADRRTHFSALGVPSTEIDDLRDLFADVAALFVHLEATISGNTTQDEQARRTALTRLNNGKDANGKNLPDGPMLPPTLDGNTNYQVTDLYDTRPP